MRPEAQHPWYSSCSWVLPGLFLSSGVNGLGPLTDDIQMSQDHVAIHSQELLSLPTPRWVAPETLATWAL